MGGRNSLEGFGVSPEDVGEEVNDADMGVPTSESGETKFSRQDLFRRRSGRPEAETKQPSHDTTRNLPDGQEPGQDPRKFTRRDFIKRLGSLGVAAAAFPGNIIYAPHLEKSLSPEQIAQEEAEKEKEAIEKLETKMQESLRRFMPWIEVKIEDYSSEWMSLAELEQAIESYTSAAEDVWRAWEKTKTDLEEITDYNGATPWTKQADLPKLTIKPVREADAGIPTVFRKDKGELQLSRESLKSFRSVVHTYEMLYDTPALLGRGGSRVITSMGIAQSILKARIDSDKADWIREWLDLFSEATLTHAGVSLNPFTHEDYPDAMHKPYSRDGIIAPSSMAVVQAINANAEKMANEASDRYQEALERGEQLHPSGREWIRYASALAFAGTNKIMGIRQPITTQTEATPAQAYHRSAHMMNRWMTARQQPGLRFNDRDHVDEFGKAYGRIVDRDYGILPFHTTKLPQAGIPRSISCLLDVKLGETANPGRSVLTLCVELDENGNSVPLVIDPSGRGSGRACSGYFVSGEYAFSKTGRLYQLPQETILGESPELGDQGTLITTIPDTLYGVSSILPHRFIPDADRQDVPEPVSSHGFIPRIQFEAARPDKSVIYPVMMATATALYHGSYGRWVSKEHGQEYSEVGQTAESAQDGLTGDPFEDNWAEQPPLPDSRKRRTINWDSQAQLIESASVAQSGENASPAVFTPAILI